VIPTRGEQRYEPLFAVYRKSVVEAANKVLARGGRKISEIFDLCRVEHFELNDSGWLVNLNTHGEYREFRKRLGG